MKLSFFPILFLLWNLAVFGQSSASAVQTNYSVDLINQVWRQDEADNEHPYRDYQYSFKMINTNEKTSRRKALSDEFYCCADGKFGLPGDFDRHER